MFTVLDRINAIVIYAINTNITLLILTHS